MAKVLHPSSDEFAAVLSRARIEPALWDPRSETTYCIQVPDSSVTGLKRFTVAEQPADPAPPSTPGNYWLLTDEPIGHCLNRADHRPVEGDDGLRVVYNGSCQNLRDRMRKHLMRACDGRDKGGPGTMSGVSIDLWMGRESSVSHLKMAFGDKKCKLPRFADKPGNPCVRCVDELMDVLRLTEQEKEYCLSNQSVAIRFKNGIDARDSKHVRYRWVFAYLEVPGPGHHCIRDMIEISWRRQHGVPLLCSYVEGR